MGFLTIFQRWMGNGSPLELGSELPLVSVQNQDGILMDWGMLVGVEWVLVYFYPKADTPGCTAQACSLRDSFVELGRLRVRVIGVSVDPCEVQRAFRERFHLPFPLLADTDRRVMRAFGVTPIPMIGLATRQSFLFRNGKLKWRDLSASTQAQAADVLRVVTENT